MNNILVDALLRIYNRRKLRQYRRENRSPRENAVVFFGDSITDKCDPGKYYPGINAYNRGISGNTTTDLLRRMDVSVFALHPSMIILLIGINDMMNEHRKPVEVRENYEKEQKLFHAIISAFNATRISGRIINGAFKSGITFLPASVINPRLSIQAPVRLLRTPLALKKPEM